MTRGPIDWLTVLDVERAVVNCHIDLIGDWYRDPWSWPELQWVVDKRPDMLAARLNGRGVQRGSNMDVPKEGFATRPAIVMDPIDRIIYQALVDRISVPAIGGLRSWVYGWRLSRKAPKAGIYNDNQDEHEWYRHRQSSLAGWFGFGLSTDIVSFFASIPVDRLCEEVTSRSSGAVTDRLVDMLQSWARVQGRTGLPQRSMASAALANMYLAPLDDVIERNATKPILGLIETSTRWMDDIWLFGRREGRLRRTQIQLEAAVRELGLNMNAAKTHVMSGDDLMEAVRQLQHSAAEQGLEESPKNTQPLEELVGRLMTNPSESSRTSIKFATVRVRVHKLWPLVQSFADNAERTPHAADALARLFRDGDRWRDLEDWFKKYAKSPWGTVDWSVGQLGTMFPSRDAGRGIVAGYLVDEIPKLPPLQRLALATQRGSAWKPAEAKQAIREAAKDADHPMQRRVLALAALSLKEERAFIRKLLREFEQNDVTLQMIEDIGFKAVKVTPDFR